MMRPILYFNGIFLVILAFCMIPPMLADLYFGYEDWLDFFTCIVLTSFFGGCLLLGNNTPKIVLSRKQAFILVNISWVIVSIFGALPFYLSSMKLGFVNSLFESISGLTTTGATVISGLDHAAAGIILWRSILQWLGGIAVILMALTIMPFLKIGGMQIFRSELASENSALPRSAQRGKLILLAYSSLTFFCMLAYMGGGMEVFDALVHAMSTISTGGFSSYDASFMHYNSLILELVAVLFMVAGGIPFVLYISAMRGDTKWLLKDTQVKAYLGLVALASSILFLHLFMVQQMPHLQAIRYSLFNTVSVITGTGYFNTNYSLWGPFCTTILIFLMVIGGCAGSTAGGIKIFRFQVLYNVVRGQIQKLLYPHSIHNPHYNGCAVSPDVPGSVLGFFFIYALCFSFLSIALALTGLDFTTAFTAAISAISNVGPGLGNIIGPGSTYNNIGEIAKFMLCIGMIIGRLELFIALVMLSPYFWKQ